MATSNLSMAEPQGGRESLDADLWRDRARDLCDHRERLVAELRRLGNDARAEPQRAAQLRPEGAPAARGTRPRPLR